GLAGRAVEVLATSVLLPQVGQGAIAVECRSDDGSTASHLAAIDDPAVRAPVETERAFLARLGGGCDLPVAAYARAEGEGDLVAEGLLASGDGRVLLRSSVRGASGEAASLGAGLAEHLLAAGGDNL
ncbi:MAG: hydroxymethylbilane synthase, partial [Acidimicrobiales bacterium]